MSIRTTVSDPMVKSILAKIGSKKRSAYLFPTNSVDYTGTYWDGGSRSKYTVIRLADMVTEAGPQFNPPQFGGPGIITVPLPPGYVIVDHGVFRGKPAVPYIYVNPENLQKFLTTAS